MTLDITATVFAVAVIADAEIVILAAAVAALAVAYFIKCLIDLSFASLPIPIAALYYIFQVPLSLPAITFWPLVLVTILVTIGLHVLIPNRRFKITDSNKNDIRFGYYEDSIDDVIEGKVRISEDGEEGNIEESGSENNPRITVQFGGGSRYLHADSLETADLDCSFGGLEVYFDHVQLNPNGAEAFVNCKFGSIELYVPRHWRIIDNMNVSLANMEVNGRKEVLDENAPTLKISGNVSFGSVEVNRIKG